MSDKKATFRGVILDVDGTLVDSNNAHAQAWVEAFADAGHDVPFEKVLRLIGMGSDKLVPECIGIEKDTPEGKKIAERRKEIFVHQLLPNIKPTSGTADLLRYMHESGLKLVVASSAEKDELQPLLEIAGATEFIQEQTSSSDAKESKPDPDIVLVALGSIGLDPAEVVMVGDTPYDVEAATKAGVAVIGVRSGGWDNQGLKGAIAVYENCADILEQYDDSPLGPAPVGG